MGTKTKKQISSNNMKNCKKSLWRYQQSHCRVCLKEKLLIIKLPNQDILLKKQARRNRRDWRNCSPPPPPPPPQIFAKVDLLSIDKKKKLVQIPLKLLVTLLLFTSEIMMKCI